MVAGDVVNTASRLQAAARPGTVLVDEATYRAVRGSIAFERAGDRSLKGKRLPVPAWEARQVVALPRGARAGASCPRARWSGRDGARRDRQGPPRRPSARSARPGSSRSSARPAWARAGSPGSSRSTSTASSRRSAGITPARRPTARASRSGRWPRWSASRAEIAEGDPPDRRPPTTGRLPRRRFVPDEAERRWIAPAPRRARSASARCPAASARRRSPPGGRSSSASPTRRPRSSSSTTSTGPTPACSTSSSTSSDASTGRPILVVDARPADAARAAPRLGRRPCATTSASTSIRCHATAMAELLGDLAPGLPADVAERILDRAEGVPLYAVEILRMLVDRGDARGRRRRLRGPRAARAAGRPGDASRRSSPPASTTSNRLTGR